jgi:cation diffusion facilitator CzcD-associated flavoprotein CzcO
MNVTATLERPHAEAAAPVDTDVLIVGAGISGLGAAKHLQDQCPWASFTIFETLESFGGTWLTHRYPGIRSDSDLYTFGYRFKPWVGKPIATADEILKYLGEVIDENRLAPHIHYRHRIDSADWSSEDKRWTIHATNLATGEKLTRTARFLWMCQGYYRHSQGYTPEWPGMADFKGTIVHPQTWPEDLDYKGKRVIGSGATAATLVPAIAGETAHVTLVQRSPTYFIPDRNANELADQLRKLEVDEHWIHEIVRRNILYNQEELTRRCKEEPEVVKAELLAAARAYLGPEFDIDTHFTPKYRPWQQRVAFIPDGDLFVGLASGKASVETSAIERFTERGLKLANGKEIEADIIVTATGFNLSINGDIAFSIDGKPCDFADTVTWRGMMFTGVPNLVWIMGYFRASWTLRVDLVADVVCRLLNHMHKSGKASVEAQIPAEAHNMPLLPWIDGEDFNPGYLQRGMHLLPKRGADREWSHTQDYWREKDELPKIDPESRALVYR